MKNFQALVSMGFKFCESYLLIWEPSTDSFADKFVDNLNVVNYTLLPQICGDFSTSFKSLDTIIHHNLFLLFHWKMLPTPFSNRS